MNTAGGTYADPSGRQWHVVRRDGWWVVLDQSREVVSGGFKRRADAFAEARRLGGGA